MGSLFLHFALGRSHLPENAILFINRPFAARFSNCCNSLNFEAKINFNATWQHELKWRKTCTGLKFDLEHFNGPQTKFICDSLYKHPVHRADSSRLRHQTMHMQIFSNINIKVSSKVQKIFEGSFLHALVHFSFYLISFSRNAKLLRWLPLSLRLGIRDLVRVNHKPFFLIFIFIFLF